MLSSYHHNLHVSTSIDQVNSDPVSSGQLPESDALLDGNRIPIVSQHVLVRIEFIRRRLPDLWHCPAKLVEDGIPHPWLRGSRHHPQRSPRPGKTSWLETEQKSRGKVRGKISNATVWTWLRIRMAIEIWVTFCRSTFDELFVMELPSEVFAIALHPTTPLLAVGLLEGHVHW